MKVQEILKGKDRVAEFLKEKGYSEEEKYADEVYPEGYFFKIDKSKLLAAYEVDNIENMKEIRKHFLIERGLSYCVIVHNGKVIFFRNFGEGRYFLYSEMTKNNVSKIDKLKRIDEKFDIIFQRKDISGVFFEEFKSKRNFLVRNIKIDIKPAEKYLLSQKIFDRIFFIYFLCHKKIITLKEGRAISGDNLFKILINNGNFFENLKDLSHRFNSTENRYFSVGNYTIRIPYLNGGLFRPDSLEADLSFSLNNSDWKAIFDFLNQYHWIIEEDVDTAIEDEERVLTPEILGHVYERSVVEWEIVGFKKEAEEATTKLGERKKKGVYYTSEEITSYIAENTIIPKIFSHFDTKYDDIEDLLENGSKNDLEKIFELVSKIKVLDPACGSGAFLIKAAEVLFQLKVRILNKLGEKSEYYQIKLATITDNIYGVDILEGAIEISKLRLWLWLVSEYGKGYEIHSLPNIEYNLRVGNSLIGWVTEKLNQISLKTPLTEQVKTTFIGLIAYSNDSERKAFQKARNLLSKFNLDAYIEAFSILYKVYRKTHGLKAENLKRTLEQIKNAIYASVDPAYLFHLNTKIDPNCQKSKRIKLPVSPSEYEAIRPFHWRVDFGFIMNDGGFDVVLGNPPYISNKKIPPIEKLIFKKFYRGVTGVMNTFALFIERAHHISDTTSIVGLIVPKNIIRSPYYKLIRKFMLDNFSINEIIDVGAGAFQFVTGETVIFIAENAKSGNTEIKITTNFFDKEFFSANEFKINYINQSVFRDQENYNFNLYLDSSKLSLKNKISKHSEYAIRDLCEVKTCIATGNDDKYVVNKPISKKYKRTLRGKDIERYRVIYNGLYVYYNPKVLHRSREERIFKAPEKTIIRTVSHNIIATYDDSNFYPLSTCIALIPKDKTNMKLITLFLNSKLINFYYDIVFNLGAHLTTEISVENIEKLPIKLPENTEKFARLFDEISVIAKSSDYSRNKEARAKVNALQNRVDHLIYKLYKLTSEEINIIESFDTN